MSFFSPPSGGSDMKDGNLDPANSFKGNSTNYSMTGLEIATIVGTIFAFMLVMFFVFYCRQVDQRRKAAANNGIANGTGYKTDENHTTILNNASPQKMPIIRRFKTYILRRKTEDIRGASGK
jgi:hypothetical protein